MRRSTLRCVSLSAQLLPVSARTLIHPAKATHHELPTRGNSCMPEFGCNITRVTSVGNAPISRRSRRFENHVPVTVDPLTASCAYICLHLHTTAAVSGILTLVFFCCLSRCFTAAVRDAVGPDSRGVCRVLAQEVHLQSESQVLYLVCPWCL